MNGLFRSPRIAWVLALIPAAVSAEYFFLFSENVISGCLSTDMRGIKQIESIFEQQYGVDCDASEDGAGTIIVICKKSHTSTIVVTRTESTCQRMRANIRRDISLAANAPRETR